MAAETFVLRSPHSPEAIIIPEMLPYFGNSNLSIKRSLVTVVVKTPDGALCVASDVGQCGHLSLAIGAECSGDIRFLHSTSKVTMVMVGTHRTKFG